MELEVTEQGELIASAFDLIANRSYTIQEAKTYLNVRGMSVSFPTLSKMLRNPF
jgi:hypothetical protein